jgi:hypothetical protein
VENMLLTTTFKLLRKAEACIPSYTKLREALRGITDEEPINLLTILEVLTLNNALWALRATEQDCTKVARLMAADFAEEVLPLWNKFCPNDTRPAAAIQAARDFAEGLITKEQLAASSAAASAASFASSYASYSASSAAYAAASAASSAAAYASFASSAAAYASFAASLSSQRQEQIFRSYLQV